MAFADLSISVSANSFKFEAGIKRANKAGTRWRKHMQRQSRLVKSAFGGIAAALGAKALINQFNSVTSEVDKLTKQARSLGIELDEWKKLEFIGEIGGVSADQMAKAVKNLQRSISNANSGLATYQRAFDLAGISMQEFADKTPVQQLLLTLQRLEQVESQADRTRLRMELFSRSGEAFANIDTSNIQALADRYESLGLGITNQTGSSMEKLRDTMTEFKFIVDRIKLSAVEIIAPQIQLAYDRFTKYIEENGGAQVVFKEIFEKIRDNTTEMVSEIKNVAQVLSDFGVSGKLALGGVLALSIIKSLFGVGLVSALKAFAAALGAATIAVKARMTANKYRTIYETTNGKMASPEGTNAAFDEDYSRRRAEAAQKKSTRRFRDFRKSLWSATKAIGKTVTRFNFLTSSILLTDFALKEFTGKGLGERSGNWLYDWLRKDSDQQRLKEAGLDAESLKRGLSAEELRVKAEELRLKQAEKMEKAADKNAQAARTRLNEEEMRKRMFTEVLDQSKKKPSEEKILSEEEKKTLLQSEIEKMEENIKKLTDNSQGLNDNTAAVNNLTAALGGDPSGGGGGRLTSVGGYENKHFGTRGLRRTGLGDRDLGVSVLRRGRDTELSSFDRLIQAQQEWENTIKANRERIKLAGAQRELNRLEGKPDGKVGGNTPSKTYKLELIGGNGERSVYYGDRPPAIPKQAAAQLSDR